LPVAEPTTPDPIIEIFTITVPQTSFYKKKRKLIYKYYYLFFTYIVRSDSFK